MIRSIILGGRKIEYDFQRKRVKNINLRIKSDMSIHVSASARVSLAEVEAFLRLKADAIIKALDRFEQNAASLSPPQYETGNTVSFLGRFYQLKVVQSTKNSVYIADGEIVLTVRDASDLELKRKTLDKWLKTQCREVIDESCGRLYPAFEKRGVKWPVEIRIRTMKSKWGSCMPQKGVLTFSTNLVAAPQECIDYVVAHEFNHFLHPDHSQSFYAELERVIPDWKRLRKELNKYSTIRQ